jgi:hypothetical protein
LEKKEVLAKSPAVKKFGLKKLDREERVTEKARGLTARVGRLVGRRSHYINEGRFPREKRTKSELSAG